MQLFKKFACIRKISINLNFKKNMMVNNNINKNKKVGLVLSSGLS